MTVALEAALDRLAAAVAAIGAGGGGNVAMFPLTLAAPVVVQPTQYLGTVGLTSSLIDNVEMLTSEASLRFTLPEVCNPRDLIAVACTVTVRSTNSGGTTYTKDQVFMFSGVGAVDQSGTTVTIPGIRGLEMKKAASPTHIPWATRAIQAFTLVSAVRYVGT